MCETVCVCVISKALGDSFPDVKKVRDETGMARGGEGGEGG